MNSVQLSSRQFTKPPAQFTKPPTPTRVNLPPKSRSFAVDSNCALIRRDTAETRSHLVCRLSLMTVLGTLIRELGP